MDRRNFLVIAIFSFGFLAILIVLKLKRKIIRKSINKKNITRKWKNLMLNLTDDKKWAQAILDADSLVDEVLKKKRYGGKTMGERLVSAQRDLTKNDAVWFAHKFSNKLTTSKDSKVKKDDVVTVLNNYKSALIDLNALEVKPKGKK